MSRRVVSPPSASDALTPDASAVERFRGDLMRLTDRRDRILVAVSGGGDSVALLLLAHAAFDGEDKIVAPLPGTVVAVLAEEGAKLEKGAPILTLEVMKMEQTLRAPFAGVLKAIKCKVGDIVQEGVELAEVEPVGE